MDSLRPSRFRLSLLGSFALTGPDGPVDLPTNKLAGLLAYLALTGPAPQPRDKLVTLFWGSHFEVQARQNLRKALFRLRHALGPDALVSIGEAISLAPGLVTCDAVRLQGLIREGSRASLAQAAGLYNGPLLSEVNISEDAWSEWLDRERQRVETLALDAMVTLGEQELQAGNNDEHPDLGIILLDINLPDRDGFSLLGELRDRYKAIAIIILSGSDEQDIVKRAFKLGALGFIPKTTEPEVMLSAIELVLSGGIYIPSEILERE
jgi:CheY-like chemotaxis protein